MTTPKCYFCGRTPAPARVWLDRFPLSACRDCHAGGRGAARLPRAGGGGTLRDRGFDADLDAAFAGDYLPPTPPARPTRPIEPVGDIEPDEPPAPPETAETLRAKLAALRRLGAPAIVLAEYEARLARLA